ncbi:MAG TPA: nitroreductase/quinone reductase family protein [Aggregatilineaceae bacterium]|nr:nitroreductase/quinone reductase family protein [Aggregatilineaceae bacterium]
MTEQFLYLTTKGWKSGEEHTVEIWFVEREGQYYLVSENREQSHWVQNIEYYPAVTFRVGPETIPGTARVVDPQVEPELAAAVSDLMDKKYGWSEGLIVELAPETRH